MKRYERMSKEAIIEIFKTTNECSTCRFRDSVTRTCTTGKDCCDAMADYLKEEIKIKTVPRWQVIKSNENLVEMREDFRAMCNTRKCGDCFCGSGKADCFVKYLVEEIEVEETI